MTLSKLQMAAIIDGEETKQAKDNHDLDWRTEKDRKKIDTHAREAKVNESEAFRRR